MTDAAHNPVLEALLSRRSASAKNLVSPGPSIDEQKIIIRAALAAPDHGMLRPWRFLSISPAARDRLADEFAAAALRANPHNAAAADKARQKALNGPCLIAVIACPQYDHPEIPVEEQLASVGAALGSLLLAANALGYGAVMLSGARVRDEHLKNALGIRDHERLMGFVTIGTPDKPLKDKPRPNVDDHFSEWPFA